MKISRFLTVSLFLFASLFLAYRPAMAKDEWLQVRTKNFLLIGNASEKDIRRVATKLEQFRETFRQIFGRMNLTSPIATNVIVFKSAASYKPFKPKRGGKPQESILGYFQPGEDVNYITLSTEGEDQDVFGVIFHEYVHFIVGTNFGKSEIPPWFNEGLAEYYETFQIVDDQKVKLGYPEPRHLMLLRDNKLVPLDQLFGVTNYQLRQSGDHSQSIFYAESWALIHYLLQGGKLDALGKFLDALTHNEPPKKAFETAFQMTYAQMEAELRKYVGASKYNYTQILFKSKLLFDDTMTVEPVNESVSDAYLGDLLVHTNQADEAEPFLQEAIKLDPNSSLANTALGMARMHQHKFSEARPYLEKAVAGDRANHLALYQYAFLLTREAGGDFGMVGKFSPETSTKIREALRKAIAIKPSFTESYELLAYINLVNEEAYDESLELLKTALKYQPGNQRYALRMAEILTRQDKFADATAIADKIAQTSDDPETQQRAQSLVSEIEQLKAYAEKRKEYENGEEDKGSSLPKLGRGNGRSKPLSEADLAKRQEMETLRSITEALRPPHTGEERVIGHIQKIDCTRQPIAYTVKTGDNVFVLTSKDFQGLSVNTFDGAASNINIGCGENISAFNAIVTFSPRPGPKAGPRGELQSVEFVPTNFRFVTDKEEVLGNEVPAADPDEAQRRAMTEAIKNELKKPAAGEKREVGFLEKIECTGKGVFYNFKTGDHVLRLLSTNPQSVQVRLFTRDLDGIQFGCALKPMDTPAVFIYSDKPDDKLKTAGEIVSIDIVPKTFVLE